MIVMVMIVVSTARGAVRVIVAVTVLMAMIV